MQEIIHFVEWFLPTDLNLTQTVMENKVRIPNPCNENWNAMSPKGNGRFCNSCDKTVIDFTKMDKPEIQKYFTENTANERICGHFKFDQVETAESIRYNNLRNRFNRIRIKPVKMLAVFSLGLFFSLSSCIMGKRAEVDGEPAVDTIKETEINNQVKDSIRKNDSIAKAAQMKEKK